MSQLEDVHACQSLGLVRTDWLVAWWQVAACGSWCKQVGVGGWRGIGGGLGDCVLLLCQTSSKVHHTSSTSYYQQGLLSQHLSSPLPSHQLQPSLLASHHKIKCMAGLRVHVGRGWLCGALSCFGALASASLRMCTMPRSQQLPERPPMSRQGQLLPTQVISADHVMLATIYHVPPATWHPE